MISASEASEVGDSCDDSTYSKQFLRLIAQTDSQISVSRCLQGFFKVSAFDERNGGTMKGSEIECMECLLLPFHRHGRSCFLTT